jgi:hypothetical protein
MECREAVHNQAAQFLGDVGLHLKMRMPRCLCGVQIKSRPLTKIPVSRRPCNAGIARAGIGCHQHDAVLRGIALRPGFGHEGFFVAGQSGQIKQHRYRVVFRLRRLVHGKAHGQADGTGLMAVKALDAAKTGVFVHAFQHQ